MKDKCDGMLSTIFPNSNSTNKGGGKKRWKIGNLRLDRLKVFALKKKKNHETISLSTVVQIIFCSFQKALFFGLCLF